MKKLFILSIAISAITLFTSCTGCEMYTETIETNETNETNEEQDFNALIAEGDFAAAHAILQTKINNCYNLNDNILGYNDAQRMYSMADVLYKEWILEVISTDTENPEMAVVQLLMEYPIFGEKKEGLQDYYYYKNAFLSGSSHFNQLCDKVLTAALLSKQYDIAEIIVNAYMEDAEVTTGDYPPIKVDGVELDGDYCYVKYSTKSKTEAQKKLNEARKKSKK